MWPVSRILLITFLSILMLYLVFFQIQAIWRFTIDDMYITLRYAHHWANHGALVWNVGEPPVEGYSNFSFVLIARVFEMLSLDPVLGLKLFSVACLVVLSIGIFLLSSEVMGGRYAMIPVIGILAYRGQIMWAVGGLETTFYQCLFVFAVFHLLRGFVNQTARSLSMAGLFFACLGWTRPEGGLLALSYFFIYGCLAYRQPHFKVLSLRLVVCFTLVYAPYFIWRWSYFGYLFPNPVYCKGLSTEFMGVLDAQYLKLAWPFFCCTLPLLWQPACRGVYLFFILPSIFYLLCCWGSDPIVAFDNRLFLPALVFLFVLATMGLSSVFSSSRYVYLLSTLLGLFAIPKMSLAEYRQFTRNPLAGERLRQEVSGWLSTWATSSQKVVLGDSGLIPYLRPELNFIDSYCLNNLEMGHANQGSRYTDFCQRLLSTRPDYIILTSWTHNGYTEYAPADACIKSILSETQAYELSNVWRSYNPDHTTYQYMLFRLNVGA